jgi:hypothetical protein
MGFLSSWSSYVAGGDRGGRVLAVCTTGAAAGFTARRRNLAAIDLNP